LGPHLQSNNLAKKAPAFLGRQRAERTFLLTLVSSSVPGEACCCSQQHSQGTVQSCFSIN